MTIAAVRGENELTFALARDGLQNHYRCQSKGPRRFSGLTVGNLTNFDFIVGGFFSHMNFDLAGNSSGVIPTADLDFNPANGSQPGYLSVNTGPNSAPIKHFCSG